MTEAQVIRAAKESIRGAAAQPEPISRERQAEMDAGGGRFQRARWGEVGDHGRSWEATYGQVSGFGR